MNLMTKNLVVIIIKEIASTLFFLLGGIYWIKLLYSKKGVLLILNYHNFSKYNNYRYKRGNILESGYAANFAEQVRFLKKHFNLIYPDDFFDQPNKKGINILITFDDGYKDNFEVAYPVLLKYNFKAIFFITTTYMERTDWLWHDKVRYLISEKVINSTEGEGILKNMNTGEPVSPEFKSKVLEEFPDNPPKQIMMRWEDVNKIVRSGMRIGSHTCNHEILSFLNSSEQEAEIARSLELIKIRTGLESIYFAYPNGLYNNTTLQLLEKYGVKYGFSTQPGLNMQNTNRLVLKRIGINSSDKISLMLIKVIKGIWK